MKKILAASLFAFLGVNISAQNATISGVVKDFKTTQTMPFINVTYGPGKGTTTDLDGKYSLSLEAGTYKLKFFTLGYDTLERKITVIAGEEKKLNVSLKEKSEILTQVVVSAGKFEQSLSKVTVSMETLSPELVENKATTNANDIVTQVPSVHTQEGQVSIRGGAGFSYGAGSRVLLMVDGIPMLSGDAGDVKWNYLPIENLENIEVIKGASSVLYGSSALNGVINIRTGFPREEPTTKINIIGNMYDRPFAGRDIKWWNGYRGNQGLNFYHSRIIKKNFDLTVGGNFFNDQGFRIDEYEQRGRINVNTRYRDQKVKGLSYGLNLNGQIAKNGLFFAYANADSTSLSPAPGTSSESQNNRFNIDPYLDYFNKKGNKHSLKTRWFNTDNNSLTTSNQSSTSDLVYGEYQYQYLNDTNFKLTSGASGTYTIVRSDLYGNHDSRNFAIYSQLDKAFFKKKLNISVGLRGEYFKIDNDESESSFTVGSTKLPFQPVVRFGANYQLAEYTFLRASYGQGYRFPTVAEKYVATSLSVVKVFPNPQLDPETGQSAEIGIKQGLKLGDWKGFLDVAGFINQYDNMMEYTFGLYDTTTFERLTAFQPGADYGFSSRNVQSARITGVDVSLAGAGKIGDVKVTVLAGYTYMNPKPVDADSAYLSSFSSLINDSTYTPLNGQYDPNKDLSSDTVSMNLKYRFNHLFKFDIQFDYNRISTGVSLRYNSYIHNIDQTFIDFDNLNSDFLDGLGNFRRDRRSGNTIIDYRLSYQLNEFSKISFLITNVMNKEYQSRPGYPMPPRTFGTQISFKF